MSSRKRTLLRAILRICSILPIVALCGSMLMAQAPSARTFQDDLLDHMLGTWQLTGTVSGKPDKQTLEAEWVLGHQFLQLHQKDLAKTGPFTFEELLYIGYDKDRKLYVAHILTVFGGGDAPVGSGNRSGNELSLVFERPNGTIAYRFTWRPDSNTWHILATNSQKEFLDLTAVR